MRIQHFALFLLIIVIGSIYQFSHPMAPGQELDKLLYKLFQATPEQEEFLSSLYMQEGVVPKKEALNAETWSLISQIPPQPLVPVDTEYAISHFYDETSLFQYNPNKRSAAHYSDPLRDDKTQKIQRTVELRACPFCTSSYAGEHGLKIHIQKKHSPPKNFECTYCNKKFRTSGECTVHQKKNHFSTSLQNKNILVAVDTSYTRCIDRLLCPTCCKAFVRWHNFKTHVKTCQK